MTYNHGNIGFVINPKACGRPEFNTITYDGPLIRAAVGTEATVKCGPRYHQKSFTITCLKSGMWSKPTGECKSKLLISKMEFLFVETIYPVSLCFD